MIPEHFPERSWLTGRRAWERTLSLSIPVLHIVAGGMSLILACLIFLRLPLSGLFAVFLAITGCWVGAFVFLLVQFFKKPSEKDLAKRADRVLGFQDDLLALSEFPAGEWQAATWRKAQEILQSNRRAWPLSFSKKHALSLFVALALTLSATWTAWHQRQNAVREESHLAAAQAARADAAEEVLKDWEEFVKTTDDPELKKLFAEASHLREAVKNSDPMAAMLAMNQIEAKLASLQDSLSAESLSPQATKMAEALEAFQGMGAMSAALRNQNYEAAAREAKKLGEKLKGEPEGFSALRRGEAVSEMLATESSVAQKRGNKALSKPLSQLSSAASQNAAKGSVPNSQISPSLDSLKDQFSKEAAAKTSQRMASIGKNQLDALRKKMRGEPCDSPPSLCQGSKPGDRPGGSKAGTGTDGQPLGDSTKLAEAGQSEQATGTAGDGESEIRTSSSSTGTSGAAGQGTKIPLAEYLALSEKAVTDESLPLAHRRAIKTYFEHIRPVAESKLP